MEEAGHTNNKPSWKGSKAKAGRRARSRHTSRRSPAPPVRHAAWRRRQRRRKIAWAVVAGVVGLLLVLVVIGSITPLRDVVLSPLAAPTPTASVPLAAGDDLFYVRVTPPWGIVSVDARSYASSQLPGGEGEMPLRLSRGTHQITWHADPFLPVRCVVSVPSLPAAQGTCNNESTLPLRSGGPAHLITFSASLANLPAAQRVALVQQAQGALDAYQSTTTVQPGEHYTRFQPGRRVTSNATAARPLQATLRFRLDTDPHSPRQCAQAGDICKANAQDCHQFCALPQTFPPSTGTGRSAPFADLSWNTVAIIYASWDYRTAGGQIVAQDQPDSASAVATEHSVILLITWDGKLWHVTAAVASSPQSLPEAGEFACTSAQELVLRNATYHMMEGARNLPVTWTFFAGANRSAGCLGAVYPAANSTATPSTRQAPIAYCLYRFGILLAVDALAHRYWPALPVADAYEQGIANGVIERYKTLLGLRPPSM